MTGAGTFAGSEQVAAELQVTGMTCGSCAARIERRLNRLDGVAATVNYATGRAYFTSTGGRDAAELIGIVPRLVAPSLNVTEPVAPAATVAVSVTVLPKVEGFNDEVRLRFEEAWSTV